MNENTSRRTWLQALLATLFYLVALPISPTAAAPLTALPKTNPAPKPAAAETLGYDYDSDPSGKVTEYTYDCQGRLTSVTNGPGNDDPDIKTYTYDV